MREVISEKIKNKSKEQLSKIDQLKNNDNKRLLNSFKLCDSSQLLANPTYNNNTVLTKAKFKNTLYLRYNMISLNLPRNYDKYGE